MHTAAILYSWTNCVFIGKLTPAELRARILDELRENHIIASAVGLAAEEEDEE